MYVAWQLTPRHSYPAHNPDQPAEYNDGQTSKEQPLAKNGYVQHAQLVRTFEIGTLEELRTKCSEKTMILNQPRLFIFRIF